MTDTTFEREQRFFVAKIKDVRAALTTEDQRTLELLLSKVDAYREASGRAHINCVVVESDWPEYNRVWDMIEARVTGGKKRRAVPTDWDNTTNLARNIREGCSWPSDKGIIMLANGVLEADKFLP